MPSSSGEEKISVVVATYREPAAIIHEALAPLRFMTEWVAEVLVLDQLGRAELAQQVTDLGSPGATKFLYHNIPDRTLAYARNRGLDLAKSNVVAFLDADAVPSPGWGKALCEAFHRHPEATAVGGRILPRFLGRPPWFVRARLAREAYSLLDHGDEPRAVDRVIGANFAVRKTGLDGVRFDEGLGRKGGALLGGEETQMCDDLSSRGRMILYWPNAMVEHQVPATRLRLRWLTRRFYYGGLSRAARGGRPRPTSSHLSLEDYGLLPLILPGYILGMLRGRRLRRRGKPE